VSESNAYISDARRTPSPALSKSLNSKPSDFCVGTPLLPSIDASRTQRESLIGVQPLGNHGQQTELDGKKYLVRIVSGANTDVGARWSLHQRRREGRQEAGNRIHSVNITGFYIVRLFIYRNERKKKHDKAQHSGKSATNLDFLVTTLTLYNSKITGVDRLWTAVCHLL
jgi:hypothetical protein